MKSLKNMEKKYSPEEIAESFIFPDTGSAKEREILLNEFRKYRKKVSGSQAETTRLIAQLL